MEQVQKILEKMYEIPNFGVYLFATIGVLVILFLIVLFLGKKDEKKRKLEEKIESSQEATPDVSPETVMPTAKEETVKFDEPAKEETVLTPEMPVIEEKKEESPVVFQPMPEMDEVKPVMEETPSSDITTPEVKEDVTIKDVKPTDVPQDKDFDFDALADAISKELEGIDNPATDNTDSAFDAIKEKEEKTEPVAVNKPEEIKTKPVMPTVFSSVYVDREKEEPKVQTDTSFDLPKMATTPEEEPKIETPAPVEEEVKPIIDESSDDDVIFPGV